MSCFCLTCFWLFIYMFVCLFVCLLGVFFSKWSDGFNNRLYLHCKCILELYLYGITCISLTYISEIENKNSSPLSQKYVLVAKYTLCKTDIWKKSEMGRMRDCYPRKTFRAETFRPEMYTTPPPHPGKYFWILRAWTIIWNKQYRLVWSI